MPEQNRTNKKEMPKQPEKKTGFGDKKLEGPNRPSE